MIQGNFFDLFDLFVNELIGTLWLTVFLGAIVIYFMSIKMNLPHPMGLLFVMLWFMIMYAISGSLTILWIIPVLFAGTIFYQRIATAIKR